MTSRKHLPGDAKLAYSLTEAAAATGVSVDTITRAHRAGDLASCHVTVNGRRVAKPLFRRTELERWLRDAS